MKILICDDDEAVVSMIRFKLTREKLGEVSVVNNGRDAKAILNDMHFDLVITDIHMPYCSGIEITQYIRETLKRSTPIIILSAEGLEDTVLQAFQMGATDFISKPFSLAELAIRVKRILSSQ
ncbi:response regulator [Chryseotalea sanaruensis]|uniref:Response regulator n=1 Tax=Chryseotalea sanaruensis TaxID=2482724 RepID=A0A401U8W1_9BACT|nr:response regulator transcription factor [Chryseotalea sanaruensis]GCC51338.1 response regulator [Chryseotalea sanaruensis]